MIFLQHVILGSLFLLLGIWFILNTYGNLKKSKTLSYHYWNGYIIGGGLVLGGIAEICGFLKW